MGDGLKLSKDKRHRSSSSLSGVVVERTRSERKLDIKASIPEVDDHFTLAEAKCNDLQEKIDLVKVLKKKKKLRKRSMTRVSEVAVPTENVPFITVRTQPKKKLIQARLRRLETPPNPVRGYVDPETVEQHRMLGQMCGYNQAYSQAQPQEVFKDQNTSGVRKAANPRPRRSQADGDAMNGRSVQNKSEDTPLNLGFGTDGVSANVSDNDFFDQRQEEFYVAANKKPVQAAWNRNNPSVAARQRHAAREVFAKEDVDHSQDRWRASSSSPQQNRRQTSYQQYNVGNQGEERPVVELFNKSRTSTSPLPARLNEDRNVKKGRDTQRFCDGEDAEIEPSPKKGKETRGSRKLKYRSRRYELPTVASQMKQAGVRYYYGTGNHSNIPFVVSKSTAPSHNIGVNIQQVLNGLKIQQPLSGIPPTIAHHMGLGHIPYCGTKSATTQQSFDQREINAIKLGRRLVRLPSYKYISYNRLLNLYREGEGMVPRFLRAISRPHYFYTSMYNLVTHREDLDGATSKGHGGSQEAKQSLAEYASLYREYEQIDKCLKEGNHEPEWERRRDELSRELAAREEHIRRVVQDYRQSSDLEPQVLRASASNAEDGHRHSTYKLNLGDPLQ